MEGAEGETVAFPPTVRSLPTQKMPSSVMGTRDLELLDLTILTSLPHKRYSQYK
jgi:hypothetical protein